MARLTADAPFVHSGCQIADSRFGAYVEIGAGTRLANTVWGDYSYCDRTCDIANAQIGKFANIASFTRIGATDHPMEKASLHHFHYRSADYWDDADHDADWFAHRASRTATIGHDTWIGHAAIVKPEVTIGHGAVIASGTVVTRDVAPYTIVGGNTARLIRRRYPEGVAERMMALAWWDWDHARLRAALPDFRSLRAEAFLEKMNDASGNLMPVPVRLASLSLAPRGFICDAWNAFISCSEEHAMKTQIIASLALALAAASPLAAQQSAWQYEATVYLFTAETETGVTTPTGTIEGTLSFKDALDNLDFAFMGAFGASNGQWSFLADYMLTDLSFGNPTPGGALSGINTRAKTQVLNAYAAYRVHETPDVAVDLAAGLRWFDTSTTLTALPGTLPGRTVVADDNWIDPVIGIRAQVALSDRWRGTAFFDYGGFQSDSESWQALLTADYALNDNWLLRFGYRYLSVDHTLSSGNEFSFTQSGPVFGDTYRF